MSVRRAAIALGLVVVSVVLQTTVFAPGNLQPFGAAPNVVLLTVIACVRSLEPEVAVLTGFTGGLLVDLLGGSPLGLWAMTMTVIAYIALRLRARAADGPLVVAIGVFGLTLIGQAIFVVVGTLFGQRTITDPALMGKVVLPAVYNVVLAPLVLWVSTLALTPRQRSWVP
jgi:rod shape-determining protein MreD